MKNLLITGGCGFIGTNYIHYLFEETNFDGNVINVDKLTYAGKKENLFNIQTTYPDRYTFFHVDVCDKIMMNYIFRNYDIDTVVHFCAESHVDNSIESPNEFINTNIVGTFNLLELSRAKGIDLFYAVSTDEVFGSIKEGSFTETSRYNPSNPYSASKASSDHLVHAYYKTFDLPIMISNCTNNYGPFQYREKLIPLIIYNAINNKPLPIYGNGTNIRDWLYVKDHCRAIWIMMNKGKIGEYYNISGSNELSNIEIVWKICDIIDELGLFTESRRDLITFVKDRPGHDFRYSLNSEKLRKELSWYPSEDIDGGIRRTVLWYIDEWLGK